MATETNPFYSLWAQGDIRERLFVHLSRSDICAVRLSNSACCNLVTRRLFQRIHLTFTANSFTRPYRVEALARIGHHIEHLTFYLPHSEATFLPPLIHPATGSEISYLYTPHTSMASTLTRPKYGNSELGDILTQQYPPLFHAATNVPSFIHAVKNVPNLRHLSIKTPGQDPAERYRRDIVDYALMSLRIAVERSPYLKKLNKLSLHGVHPAAFLYLKFQDGPGFGCSPIAGKRWRQIRKMHIAVEAWDFYGPGGPGLDQLKIIDDYLRQFQDSLEKLSFTWVGQKGPCPLALAEDPLFDTPRENKKLFNEVTSPMSPLPPRPGVRGRIRFSRLRYLQVRNASMHAAQLRGLVESHRDSVKEFDFENVVLLNGGNWDDALQPLMKSPTEENHRDTWARYSLLDLESELEASLGLHLSQTSSSDQTIRCGEGSFDDGDSYSYYGDEAETIIVELDRDIDSAINLTSTNASEATLVPFSTKLKKRVRKRRRKPWHPKREGEDGCTDDDDQQQRAGLALAPTKSNRSREEEPAEDGMVAPLNISAPIISTEALPVLLQPMVYNPQASTTNGGGHNVNEGLSAVQRNLEQEEIQRRFAEDAEARTSALKKAREAVLEKLGRLQGKEGKVDEEELLDMHPALQDEYGLRPRGGSGGSGRLRELFGAVRSNSNGGEKGHAEGLYMNVEESNTVLVPLVFSPTRG
ncbi:hypothetical protein M406DRAFT_296186 [Cryphonectria parasitica EP155]|uniref:Uncharacterized protein n=1 Tax=Cryphonectria parasitica (strain ATCC 38755 / EP155) TaxID=660469 RepID=A0A9P4XU22_CRYP1|nr:uncharacterized protein M406DRAFT_296186 [Cryphonectria parasitica EP155]KAF3760765.1 hypothetical protein M406DRAFT_296186 [Cryphonectria parasitica EP155]